MQFLQKVHNPPNKPGSLNQKNLPRAPGHPPTATTGDHPRSSHLRCQVGHLGGFSFDAQQTQGQRKTLPRLVGVSVSGVPSVGWGRKKTGDTGDVLPSGKFQLTWAGNGKATIFLVGNTSTHSWSKNSSQLC